MRHSGELAEWSNAAVLKTVEGHTSGGSNPSFSAKETRNVVAGFLFSEASETRFSLRKKTKNQTSTARCGFHACPGFSFGITAGNPFEKLVSACTRKQKTKRAQLVVGFMLAKDSYLR